MQTQNHIKKNSVLHGFYPLTLIEELQALVKYQNKNTVPTIIMAGLLFTGKSSTLDKLIEQVFLTSQNNYRGESTKFPIHIQLRYYAGSRQQPFAYWNEAQGPGKNTFFTDFSLLFKQILDKTNRFTNYGQKISQKPVVITIFSSKFPNLNIIQLPGIALHPVNNPSSVQEIDKKLILNYINKDSPIILCVLPANYDLTMHVNLKIARDADPEGKRTIGCLTKIDLMDRGTDAYKYLVNQEIPLRMGYVGIKNRSQYDVFEQIKIQANLKEEQLYFKKHPIYSSLNSDYWGTVSLRKKISLTIAFQRLEKLKEILKVWKWKAIKLQKMCGQVHINDKIEAEDKQDNISQQDIENYVELIKRLKEQNNEIVNYLDEILSKQSQEKKNKKQIKTEFEWKKEIKKQKQVIKMEENVCQIRQKTKNQKENQDIKENRKKTFKNLFGLP